MADTAQPMIVGVHYLIELNQVDPSKFLDGNSYQERISKLITDHGGTVLNAMYYNFPNDLGANATTLVILLSESHFSIHTWPEHNYAAIDLFTCGQKAKTSEIVKGLLDYFSTPNYIIHKLERGMKPNIDRCHLFGRLHQD